MIKITPEAKRIKDRREARRVLKALNQYDDSVSEAARNDKFRARLDGMGFGQSPFEKAAAMNGLKFYQWF